MIFSVATATAASAAAQAMVVVGVSVDLISLRCYRTEIRFAWITTTHKQIEKEFGDNLIIYISNILWYILTCRVYNFLWHSYILLLLTMFSLHSCLYYFFSCCESMD